MVTPTDEQITARDSHPPNRAPGWTAHPLRSLLRSVHLLGRKLRAFSVHELPEEFEKQPRVDLPASTEQIILVHGTAASKPGPPGEEKWWQPNSAFVSELLASLATQNAGNDTKREFTPESFPWSGANSERDRRRYGRELAKKLIKLEQENIPYHLIGHSHGGSVIWHALKQVIRIRRPKMLQTWVTVGTPFLTFSDRGNLYSFLFLLMVAILGSLSHYFLKEIPDVILAEYIRIFRDAHAAAISAAIASSILISALFLYCLFSMTNQFLIRLLPMLSYGRRLDYAYVGQRWLPIVHDHDEPVSGLTALVRLRAEPFMPRLRTVFNNNDTASNHTTRDISAINQADNVRNSVAIAIQSIFRATILLPYNQIIAPILDQFLWETVKRVIQGNDVPGEFLVSCNVAPPELQSYWAQTSVQLQNKLTEMAEAAAGPMANAMRRLLSELSRGNTVVAEAKRIITWKEIIHTSYFETPIGITGLIAPRILEENDSLAGNPATEAPPFKTVSLKPWRPYLLYSTLASVVIASGTAAIGLTAAIHTAWLSPVTNNFQIKRIREDLFSASQDSLHFLPQLDQILARWVLLDQTDDALSVAARLDDLNIRTKQENGWLKQMQSIAFAAGAKGSESDLVKLLANINCHDGNTADCRELLTKPEIEAILLVHALAGSLFASSNIHKGVTEKLSSSLDKATPDARSHAHIIEVLLSSQAYDTAATMANRINDYCRGVLSWAEKATERVQSSQVPTLLRECLADPLRGFEQELEYSYENGLNESAKQLRLLVTKLALGKKKQCSVELVLAVNAMDACRRDKSALLISKTATKSYGVTNNESVAGLLKDISDAIGSSYPDPPACITHLNDKLEFLSGCLTSSESPVDRSKNKESNESKSSDLGWTKRFWVDSAAPPNTQPEICEDVLGISQQYGRRISAFADTLSELTSTDEADVRRSVTLRSEYEFGREPKNVTEEVSQTTQRCGWAMLGLAWLRLGDDREATKIFDKLICLEERRGASKCPEEPKEMLDFYLAIADAISKFTPRLAKPFLDHSFTEVAKNDPRNFPGTSDGSADQFFVYTKEDIARLYAKIGEYSSAAQAYSRFDKLNEEYVSANLYILDTEIVNRTKYGRNALNALQAAKQLPHYSIGN